MGGNYPLVLTAGGSPNQNEPRIARMTRMGRHCLRQKQTGNGQRRHSAAHPLNPRTLRLVWLVSRVFLQAGPRFARFKRFSRAFDDKVAENRRVNQGLDVNDSVLRQSTPEFVCKTAAINRQHFDQMTLIGAAHVLNLDVIKRMGKGIDRHVLSNQFSFRWRC